MCSIDGEESQAWAVTTPTARKRHRCHECHGPIFPGEKHERVGSLYDGSWETLRVCPACSRAWSKMAAICRLRGADGVVLGGLHEELRYGEDDPRVAKIAKRWHRETNERREITP